jgi:cystathionine gamma-synthase
MPRGAGCLLSFEVESAAAGDRLLAELRLIRHATSFGGVETSCERRSRAALGGHRGGRGPVA